MWFVPTNYITLSDELHVSFLFLSATLPDAGKGLAPHWQQKRSGREPFAEAVLQVQCVHGGVAPCCSYPDEAWHLRCAELLRKDRLPCQPWFELHSTR